MKYEPASWSRATSLLVALMSVNLCGLIGCKKSSTPTPAGEALYPLHIAWETEVTQPIRVRDAPTIVYKRTGDLELETVAWSVKLLSGDPAQPVSTSINCPVPVHIPGKKGIVTGESGLWTEVVEIALSYIMSGISGETQIRIALVEPKTQTEELENWTPRQLSNWLTLPIKLESD